MGEFVYLEVAGGIGTIRLNRPKVNALNDQVTRELAEAARGVATSEDVSAVIVYGGEKVFAGGADIAAMAEAGYAEMALRAARLQEAGHLLMGGAILDDAGRMIGSAAVAQFDTREELDEWLRTDPYVTGGVWRDIQVIPYRVAPHFLAATAES